MSTKTKKRHTSKTETKVVEDKEKSKIKEVRIKEPTVKKEKASKKSVDIQKKVPEKKGNPKTAPSAEEQAKKRKIDDDTQEAFSRFEERVRQREADSKKEKVKKNRRSLTFGKKNKIAKKELKAGIKQNTVPKPKTESKATGKSAEQILQQLEEEGMGWDIDEKEVTVMPESTIHENPPKRRKRRTHKRSNSDSVIQGFNKPTREKKKTVQKILEKKERKGRILFYVQWKSRRAESNYSWEEEESLMESCPDLVKGFNESQVVSGSKTAPKKKTKSKTKSSLLV